MSDILLEAESRLDIGKGASRRLRRLENKVPGVIYGGDKKPHSIHLHHNKVIKALESEAIYSSIFDLKLDGKVERVILKDLQRHPYKPIVLHMDLQRVSATDVLVRMIPLHFTHEEESKGVKDGGMVNHSMMQVEVRCQAKHLPEFIEVDLTDLGLDEVLHLSHLKLPKGVKLTADVADGSHDLPVVSIHRNKGNLNDTEEAEVEVSKEDNAESEEAAE